MRTADFDYVLPPELIAQQPLPERDQSRLLVLHRGSGAIEHRRFPDLLEFLQAGDVLVLNNSKVIPARLRGVNERTGGQFELLLLHANATNDWWAMVRPGKRARPGTGIALRGADGKETGILANVAEHNEDGHRRLIFSGTPDIAKELLRIGEVPLPPYIERLNAGSLEVDRQRYQTVFAEPAGSVAAPTAGLHFSEGLLERVRARGIHTCFVTLHVGLGTFAPVKSETLAGHTMHQEQYELGPETVRTIAEAKRTGRRVIAVGTTSVRVLESVAAVGDLSVSAPGQGSRTGSTKIFIYPPYKFNVVDGLVTNFHLPRSTLLMLVSAFAAPGQTQGREVVLAAYREAIGQRYPFYSYGDAMLLL